MATLQEDNPKDQNPCARCHLDGAVVRVVQEHRTCVNCGEPAVTVAATWKDGRLDIMELCQRHHTMLLAASNGTIPHNCKRAGFEPAANDPGEGPETDVPL